MEKTIVQIQKLIGAGHKNGFPNVGLNQLFLPFAKGILKRTNKLLILCAQNIYLLILKVGFPIVSIMSKSLKE